MKYAHCCEGAGQERNTPTRAHEQHMAEHTHSHCQLKMSTCLPDLFAHRQPRGQDSVVTSQTSDAGSLAQLSAARPAVRQKEKKKKQLIFFDS